MKPYYQEKNITIIHGDNREVLPELGIYDLCLTDPPYGVELDYASYNDTHENLKKIIISETFPMVRRSAVVTLLTPGTKNLFDYPRPDWVIAWFSPQADSLGPWGFCEWQPVLCYGADPYLREAMGGRGDSIRLSTQGTQKDIQHPCPKPVNVWKWLLKRGASRDTDTVLDPFMGSGTTLVVAKELGHKALGIELEEKYCEIAANRLRQGQLF